jgi:glycosyltransferase involved in cell wall biosynthesis
LLTQSLESPGGAGRYLPLAKALVRLGHQVTILALHHDLARAERRHFWQDAVEVYYVGQMHVHKSDNTKRYFGTRRLLWITAVATLKLAWHGLRLPADAVQVCKSQPMNGLAAWIIHRLKGVPVYVDSDDHEAINNRFGGRWQQRIVAWCENRLPAFAQAVTVGNSHVAAHFRALGYPPQKFTMVRNGVEQARFQVLAEPEAPARIETIRRSLDLPEMEKTFVYVGSMSLTSHAVDLLLEAFQQATAHYPEAVLVLVGSGEDLAALQQMAQRLEIGDAVRFVGYVPADAVPFYYRLGVASLDPRRRTAQAASSLSLKLVESLAAETPCITAKIGDLPQVLGEGGLCVPPDDAPALAEAMLSMLRRPEQAAEMRRAARRRASDLWWREKARLFHQLYLEAGGEKGAHR